MPWTPPRTWVHNEIATAAMFDVHVRDNLNVIKTTRDAQGKIIDISPATVADLSSANITGLARPNASNDFTGGTTRFTGTSRCVLPVGVDKYEVLGGGLRRGVWVEGDSLHSIMPDQTTEKKYLGEVVSTPPGALPGSVWIEGEYLHYIDATGVERRCRSLNAAGAHTDVGAIAGSLWVESDFLHWIQEGGQVERPGHADVAHSDGLSHNDTHSDVAHSDSHSDVGHADSHGDVAHSDFHEDFHGDNRPEEPHEDIHDDNHGDVVHGDSHTDTAHADSHSDSHSDSHDDHSDHADVVHSDQPTTVP